MISKVTQGQAFRPSAREWNELAEASRAALERRFGGPSPPAAPRIAAGGRPPLRVRNDADNELARFAVVGLGNLVIGPDDNFGGMVAQPCLSAVVPRVEDHGHRFAVLQQPLRPGQIGFAVDDGPTWCQVNLNDTGDVVCGISDDDATELTSGTGLCRILAIPENASTGTTWCRVRVGEAHCEFVAVANGSISARSGTTPGSGNCDLKWIGADGEYATFSASNAVKNWTATAIDDGDWLWVGADAFGRLHVKERDCS